MTSLETRISQAIETLEVPDVDLVESVLAQLPIDPQPMRRRRPQLAIALAALAFVAGIIFIAPAREAVANWLGIGATDIQPLEELELPEASSVDDLGERVGTTSVDELAIVDPIPSLGRPNGVFDDENRGRSYTWPASDILPEIGDSAIGVVLSVRSADRVLSAKFIANDVDLSRVEFANVGRSGALWIDGQHFLVQAGSSRPVTANQVLLWVVDDVEFRLETALTLPAVVSLAEEINEGTKLLAPG